MAESNKLAPIPKPPGKPVVGNALTVDAGAPLQSLKTLADEYGPIFWMDIMGTPIVLVSGADLVQELCDETRFDKSVRGPLRRLRVIGGDGLFTGDTTAPNWSKAHNILMPTFSQKSMRGYLPMMVDIAEQLMLKWERLNADDEIDVPRDMIGLTLDTIGLCGFDYRFNSFYSEEFHPFIDALTRTLEIAMLQRGLPMENFMLRDRLKQLGRDVDYMNTLVDDIIRQRRKTGGDQKDLLNFMLAGRDPVTGEGLSDENIRYQINTFLIAGHETTSGMLSFALYYLLKNPDVLTRAYEEADRVLGRDISQAPTMAQIGQLDYIRAVLSEALRLWPTAPAFSVAPFKDEVIGGKYPLPKGVFVNILGLSLHRDKTVWGETPDVFNPENFLGDAEAKRHPAGYKPFGNGQRACIGRQFAMQEAVMVMGMILQRFQLFDHTDYQLKIKETLSLKPDGFRIKVALRPDIVRGSGRAVAEAETTARADNRAQRPKHDTPLYVLYGSNLGATESLARDVAQTGELNGFAVTMAGLDDYAGRMPTDGPVVILSASYNGAPPNNAVRFVDWLDAAGPEDVRDVSFLVFGCGNRDWAATFQSVPRTIDERLTALGANCLIPRAEGDARDDLDGQFQTWLAGLWPSLGEALDLAIDFDRPVDAEPLYKVEIAESVTANPVANQAGAVDMTILENRELQTHADGASETRSTRHIEIALPDGVSYEPGDHLCVVPVNPPALVERALNRIGLDADAYVRIESRSQMRGPFPSGSTFSVRRLAERYGELQAVATRKDIAVLASYTQCPDSRAKLEAIAAPAKNGSDLYRSDVQAKRKSVLDLLEEYPACDLPFAVFLEMIPWLTPRYYSISSSMRAAPDRCSITVAVVEGPARSGNGVYRGICSTHLADMAAGETVQAAIQKPSAPFRMPEDPSVPIVMIGPGTGLAPFRGFIQARRATKGGGAQLGEAMLFFGCRRPDEDFIYADELKAAEADGLITLHTAFSRAQDERIYVQDVLRKEQAAVWRLIEEGAIVYVCGDGAGMEPDVRRALTKIYAENADVDFSQAEAWMDDFASKGRYVLDVWAG
ncbi:MAG: cytochrome P450 [Pseudomonadota bacterium]